MTASRYRGSLAVWALLLAYASLYPFHPLRPPPPEVLREFMTATRYMIRSDIAFNVVPQSGDQSAIRVSSVAMPHAVLQVCPSA